MAAAPLAGAARGNAPLPDASQLDLRTLKAARVVFNSDCSSYDVIIRDMSDSGVRMKLGAAFAVPDHFDLIIANPNSGKKDRKACEKVWEAVTDKNNIQ